MLSKNQWIRRTKSRIPKSSSCPNLNNTGTLNGHWSRQTANITFVMPNAIRATRWHCCHMTICVDVSYSNSKAKAVACRDCCLLHWMRETAFSLYICGSLAQTLIVLDPFFVHRETESWPIMHTHQRGHGLLWKSTAVLCTADGYTHTQTNTHNLSLFFLLFEWYYQRAQPEGFSISARLLLNWSVLLSFRINNSGLMDALGPNKATFFVKETHIRTALIPTEKHFLYDVCRGSHTVCVKNKLRDSVRCFEGQRVDG